MAGAHRAPSRSNRTWPVRAAIAVTGIAGTVGMAPGASGAPIALPLTNTVITPGNAADHGFGEPDTRPDGDIDFTEEYGAPSGGNKGALAVSTGTGASKATYFTTEKNGPLADFATSASYATYKASSSTGDPIQYPSYQITIDRNGGTLDMGDYATLFYEPYYNVDDVGSDLKLDEWQTWDVTRGTFCSTKAIPGYDGTPDQKFCGNGGQRTLDEVLALNPDATVLGFGVNQGSGNPGITAAVDLLKGAGTTYDFEVTEPPVVIPDPDPDPDPGDEPCVRPDDPNSGENPTHDGGPPPKHGKHHGSNGHEGKGHDGKGQGGKDDGDSCPGPSDQPGEDRDTGGNDSGWSGKGDEDGALPGF